MEAIGLVAGTPRTPPRNSYVVRPCLAGRRLEKSRQLPALMGYQSRMLGENRQESEFVGNGHKLTASRRVDSDYPSPSLGCGTKSTGLLLAHFALGG
jgi:hypothetical protein